jgi:hypothetical protein
MLLSSVIFGAPLLLCAAVSALSSTPRYHSCIPDIQTLGLNVSVAEAYAALLPGNVQCGSIDAPLDWSLPMSESNFLTLGFSIMKSASGHGRSLRATLWEPG